MEQNTFFYFPPQGCVMVVIRGIPGSGKTVLATALGAMYRTHGVPVHLHSLNQKFYTPNGEYKFDARRFQEMIAQCDQETSKFFEENIDNGAIIFDGTNLKDSDFIHHVDKGLSEGWDLQVIDCGSTFHSHHKIPEKVLNAQKGRWKPFPMGVLQRIKDEDAEEDSLYNE